MRAILLLSSLILFFGANAQTYMDTSNPDDKKVKSLISSDNEIGYFGGIDAKVTKFHEDNVVIGGMYTGVIVNRHYILGLGGYGLLTKSEYQGSYVSSEPDRTLNIHGGYGGVILGVMFFSNEVVHVSMPILLGAGSFEVTDKNFYDYEYNSTEVTIERSGLLCAEPALQLEVNITKSLRLSGGVSYRLINASSLDHLTDQDLSGMATTISLRFGRF